MIRSLKKVFNIPIMSSVRNDFSALLFPYHSTAMLEELAKVPVLSSGVENDDIQSFPFVVLEDGIKLYGMLPNELERKIYRYWKRRIASNVTEETFRVAIDVVLRYQYPHAMPYLVPPYPRAKRYFFHPQHRETIWDLPNYSSEQKKLLVKEFTVVSNETFMDVGAYIGFGVVRLAKEIGINGRVIAVEADPNAFKILKRNVEINRLTNVTLIQKAVSQKTGSSFFFKTQRQANSLITGVVDTNNIIRVEVDTIDNILYTQGITTLDRLSITINGAEVDAIDGSKDMLANSPRLKISLAGWYKINDKRICDLIAPKLSTYGLKVAIGRDGGVFAWKPS